MWWTALLSSTQVCSVKIMYMTHISKQSPALKPSLFTCASPGYDKGGPEDLVVVVYLLHLVWYKLLPNSRRPRHGIWPLHLIFKKCHHRNLTEDSFKLVMLFTFQTYSQPYGSPITSTFVLPSVLTKQPDKHWTDFDEIWYWGKVKRKVVSVLN
jgi:hypothetical protein